MNKIFIDGSAGTTGLRIYERLKERKDIELLILPDELRKDPKSIKEAIFQSDISFLCLPDDAAREAVALAEGSSAVIIDTSTAHRTADGWAYGFPELSPEHRQKILACDRIASPGCHASGFIALVYPLIKAGVLESSAPLSCFSLTGYSGGGKKMIAQYEAQDRDPLLHAPRQYGLGQTHKHLKEMQCQTGVDIPPVFCPVVADIYSGMQVTVPLHKSMLKGASVEDIAKIYKAQYNTPIVYCADCGEEGFLNAGALSGKDTMAVAAYGNNDRIILCATYDNLGKGASGAAIECMNIKLGLAPETGLEI